MNETQTSSSNAMQFSPISDIKTYARLIWRRLWLIVLCALLGGAAAYFASSNMTPIYRAQTRLMINEAQSNTSSSYSDILASERAARTYAELLQRGTMLQGALNRLGLDDEALARAGQVTGVTVTPVRDTRLVNLAVEGTNPQLIAAVANTLPQVFVSELRSIQSDRYADSRESFESQLATLGRQVEETELRLTELETRARTPQEEIEFGRLQNALTQYQSSYAGVLQSYESLRLAEVQSIENIVVVEQALVPLAPIRPRVLTNTLLGAIIGAMLALGTIFLIEFLDDRIRNPEDLKRIADIPVVGTIGKFSNGAKNEAVGIEQIISIQEPRDPTVEAFRRLRTNLQYYNIDTPLRSVSVTSANPSEGKSSTAANLAVVMAQSGLSVVLIDADLRKPKVHKNFDLFRKPGLTEALMHHQQLNPLDEVFAQRTGDELPQVSPLAMCNRIREVPNLYVMTAGEKVPNPAELLNSKRMADFIDQLRAEVDIVIFDTPPLLAVTDAQIMGRMVDGTILVIDTQKTSGGAVYRALETLVQVNVPIMGAVLNRVSGSGHGYYYYTYDYYGSESDEGEEGGPRGGNRSAGDYLRPRTGGSSADPQAAG